MPETQLQVSLITQPNQQHRDAIHLGPLPDFTRRKRNYLRYLCVRRSPQFHACTGTVDVILLSSVVIAINGPVMIRISLEAKHRSLGSAEALAAARLHHHHRTVSRSSLILCRVILKP